jgi:hypothetical protein
VTIIGLWQAPESASGGDVNNMLIEVGGDSIVSGTVIVDGGPAPRSIFLALTTDEISGGVLARATVQGDRFTIRSVPPAKMYFFINLEQDVERYYVKSITWKGKDLLREPLEVGVETKIEGVQIVLSPQVASFTIRVRTPRRKPVADADSPSDNIAALRWMFNPDSERWRTTDNTAKRHSAISRVLWLWWRESLRITPFRTKTEPNYPGSATEPINSTTPVALSRIAKKNG